MTREYMIHGTTDEVTTCDCCGKPNLNTTVILEVISGDNAGDLLNFGSHCAARALGMRKSHADLVILKAKRAQKIKPVVDFVKANIHRGIEAIKKDAQDMAKSMRIDVTVSGFDSWGQMNIHGYGFSVEVKA